MVVVVGRLPSIEFCRRVLLDPLVEKAWMYSQLGLSQEKIGQKLGIRPQKIGVLLKERHEAAKYVDVRDGLDAKLRNWEPWHVLDRY